MLFDFGAHQRIVTRRSGSSGENIMRLYLSVVIFTFIVSLASFADIKLSPDDVEPLDINDHIPNPTLTRMNGEKVSLADVVGGKPAVLIFFRGGWCPYCTKHLAALKDVIPQLKDLGFEVVAISPDSIESNQKAIDDKGIDYTVLSDADFEAIQEFRLAFKLDDETLKLYDTYGLKLIPMPETGDTVLPVPAIYVIDSLGIIQFRQYDPDYRKRLDPELLLQAVKGLQ